MCDSDQDRGVFDTPSNVGQVEQLDAADSVAGQDVAVVVPDVDGGEAGPAMAGDVYTLVMT